MVSFIFHFCLNKGTLALGRQAGCSPFIHIYNTSEGKRLIYSTENEGEDPKYPIFHITL